MNGKISTAPKISAFMVAKAAFQRLGGGIYAIRLFNVLFKRPNEPKTRQSLQNIRFYNLLKQKNEVEHEVSFSKRLKSC